MGKKPHIIPNLISNFITHSILFCFQCFHFSIPRARFPFPVPCFGNIAIQNCASTVIIFNMPRENKGRRAGLDLKISGHKLPVEKDLYKGCPLLPLYPFLTCVNEIYKNLRDTNVLLNSKNGSDQSFERYLDLLKLFAVTEVHAARRTSMQSSLLRFDSLSILFLHFHFSRSLLRFRWPTCYNDFLYDEL